MDQLQERELDDKKIPQRSHDDVCVSIGELIMENDQEMQPLYPYGLAFDSEDRLTLH